MSSRSSQPRNLVESSASRSRSVRTTAQELPIQVPQSIGAKLEIGFGLMACVCFIVLECLILFKFGCDVSEAGKYSIVSFALLGIVFSVYIVFHNGFKLKLIIGRGVVGYILFFILSSIILLNLVGAFLATSCVCKCPPSANAFIMKSEPDITIFFLEIFGSLFLGCILLISAIKRRKELP